MLRFRINGLLIGFIVGLVLSGLTTFPLPQEMNLLIQWLGVPSGTRPEGLAGWIVTVRDALVATESKYPFLFYGYDWLGFAHLVIALLFWGPLKDPVRNIWVIHWAMMACVAIFPLALICGAIRGIPFGWQLIDCSFGVVGLVPLWFCDRYIRELERLSAA